MMSIEIENEKMDTDLDEVCVLKCPFCAKLYVLTHIFTYHLSAHIGFHSTARKYKCFLCPVKGNDATNIAVHVSRCHSKPRRHSALSPLVHRIKADNLVEKETIIAMLASSDDPQLRPSLPY